MFRSTKADRNLTKKTQENDEEEDEFDKIYFN